MDQYGGGSSAYEPGWQDNLPQADAAAGYSPSAASIPIHQEDVKQITSMGFTEDQAREALTEMEGKLEFAVNYLIGIDDAPPSTDQKPPPAPPPPQHQQSPYNNHNYESQQQIHQQSSDPRFGPFYDQKLPSSPLQKVQRAHSSEASAEISRSVAQQYRERFNSGGAGESSSSNNHSQIYDSSDRSRGAGSSSYSGGRSNHGPPVLPSRMQSGGSTTRQSYSREPATRSSTDYSNSDTRMAPYAVSQDSMAPSTPSYASEPPPMEMPTPRSNADNNPLVAEYRAAFKGSDSNPSPAQNSATMPNVAEPQRMEISAPRPSAGGYNPLEAEYRAMLKGGDSKPPASTPTSMGRQRSQGGTDLHSTARYERAASPHGARGNVRDIRNELEQLSTGSGGAHHRSAGLASGPRISGTFSSSHDQTNQGSRGRALPTSRYDRAASPHGLRGHDTGYSEMQSPGRQNYGSVPLGSGSHDPGTYSNDRNAQGSRGRDLPIGRYNRAASPHGARERVAGMRHGGNDTNSQVDNAGSFPLRDDPSHVSEQRTGSRGRALPTGKFDRAASPHGIRSAVNANNSPPGGTDVLSSAMDNIGSFPVLDESGRTGSRGRALPTNRQDQPTSSRGRGRDKKGEGDTMKKSKVGRSPSPGTLRNMFRKKNKDKPTENDDDDDDKSTGSFERRPVKKSNSWNALSKLKKKKKRSSVEGIKNAPFDDATAAAQVGDDMISMPDASQQKPFKKTSSWGNLRKRQPAKTKSNDVDEIKAINQILGTSKPEPIADPNTQELSRRMQSSRQRLKTTGPKSKNKSLPSSKGWLNPLVAGSANNQSTHTRSVPTPNDNIIMGSEDRSHASTVPPTSIARGQTGPGEYSLQASQTGSEVSTSDSGHKQRQKPAAFRSPVPINSNDNVSPMMTTTKQHKVISPRTTMTTIKSNNHSPVPSKSPPALIEISPGVKVPLIDAETTKRAYEKRMIGCQTCMDCQRVSNCVDMVDYVICPHCNVVSPRKFPQGRRQVQMTGATRVALGFTGELDI